MTEPRPRTPNFAATSFDGPDDAFERLHHMGQAELPGMTWAEGHMFEYPSLFMPNLDMENGGFDDRVWQYSYPDRLSVAVDKDSRVLGDIFYSNAVRRLQAVEQLTLPPRYTTVPNTGAFSRFEHIWGSVLFVQQMARLHGITGRDAVTLQLRTLVSDMAHTFGSHLGDWMFQGVGGGENQHDIELAAYLEAMGINDTLRKHGYDPTEVTFPDVNDWVEADQPDLCVDRVDYGLREMNRWNRVVHNHAFKAEDFAITSEGMLAMNDPQRARVFAEGFLLLSQEHWSEPTHRFMLDMLMLRTKLFYGQGRAPRSWVFEELPKLGLVPLHEIHPRDLMYVTEPAQEQAYAMPDLSGHTLEAIMTSVAAYRRQYVWPARAQRIEKYMMQFTQPKTQYEPFDSAVFNGYRDEYPASLPTGFAILDIDQAAATANDFSFDFIQQPFKTRQVDPLVRDGSGFKRLSEIQPDFADRLAAHKAALAVPKVARLSIADPKTLDLMHGIVDNVEADWQDRLRRSRRMTAAELRELVAASAREIHGQYPFMSHFSH